MNATDLTFGDLQRTAIRVEQEVGNQPSIVYRLGDFDDSAPLSLGGRSNGKDVYYSALVLMSFPPTTSIN
jgi:hypothetical protein